MKVINKLKYIYSSIILSAIVFAVLSLSFVTPKTVYAATDYNDQGYARTISVAQNIPLYTIDGGSADILSCFGYAQNRDLNFVGADYTSSADDGRTFVYNATGASTVSKGNCLIYQLIYIPEHYITAINKGALTASVTAEFYSPSAGGQDAADKITMTLANLNSRTYSASKNMSLSSFDILDSKNVAETRASSGTSTISGFQVKTTTLALFFGPEFVNCSGWTRNTTMTIKSPTLTLTSTDTAAPVISLSSSNQAYAKEKTITASINENISGIRQVNVYKGDAVATGGNVSSFVKLESKTFEQYDVMTTSYPFVINENGAYTVEVFDNLGNRSYKVHNETKIDKITPESPLIMGISDGDIFYSKQITFQALYEIGEVQSDEYYVYTIDGTTPTKDDFALINGDNTFVVENIGPYVLKVLSFDMAGNSTSVQEFDFYVDDSFYNVTVTTSDGVEASQGVEGLRYSNEYAFEYTVLDGYELHYIEVNGEQITFEGNSKTFRIEGNLDIKIQARKIVNVWLNVDKYKYDGTELTLDFSQDYGESEIVDFKYYVDGVETIFQEPAEYVVKYNIDTQNYVGSGEFTAKITDKEIAVITLNKTEYVYDTNGFVLDYTSNVDADCITFEFFANAQPVEPQDVGVYSVVYSVDTETHEGSGVLNFAIVQKQILINVEKSDFVYDGKEKIPQFSNDYLAAMQIVIMQNDNVTTAINAGVYNYIITVTDKNYCGETSGSFEIKRAEPKITLKNTQFVYNGTKQDLGISVEYNVSYNLILKSEGVSVNSIINAGQYTYEITVDEQNYVAKLEGSVVVEKRDIIVTANSYTITYGENIPEFNYKIDNAIASDNISFDIVSTDIQNNAGEYLIELVQKTLDNYNVTYKNGVLVIMQKQLQVFAPVDMYKYYGENDPEFVVTYDKNEIEFDDILTFTITRESGENVGEYQISDITSDNANYKLNVVSSVFKIIKKRIVVKALSTSKTYGEKDCELSYKVTFGELINNDVLEGTLTREQGEDVGEYSILVGTLDNPNYEILFLSGKLTISPKQISVVADDKSIIYGEEDCELTYTVDGLLDGDCLLGNLQRENGVNVGKYEIGLGSLNNKNYQIEFTNADFVIEKRTLNVIADEISCVYGEQEKQLTYQVSNIVYNDKFEFCLFREQGEDVGEYLIQLQPVELENYIIDYSEALYIITPKSIVLEVVPNQGKVFGEIDPELKYTIDGLETKLEGVSISRQVGEDAGQYEIVLAIEELHNYTIEQLINGVFEISKAMPTLTLKDKQVIYNGQVHDLKIQEDFIVSYVYKQNGIEVDAPVNAGEYSVVAVFEGDKNYKAANSNVAMLIIDKQKVSISVEQEYFVYDGKVKMPLFKTNIECETIIEIYSQYGAQLNNVSDIGVYEYRIVVNSQNYEGVASGSMVIAEKKVYPGNDGNQIEDIQGDFSKNNVIIELKRNNNQDTIVSINNALEEKYLYSAYYFDVIGELPKNTKVLVKIDATEIDDITEYSLYYYNNAYQFKEISYKYEDGKIVFEVSDFDLGIALTRNSTTSMFVLLLFGVFIILTMFITATIAIKIYKFMRVKAVVANSGLEQTITFAKKNKNKKVNKIIKQLEKSDENFDDEQAEVGEQQSNQDDFEENNDN